MFPSFWVTLLGVISTWTLYSACSVWNDIFIDADISFAFTYENKMLLDVEKDFPYFQALRLANSYTPLRSFSPNQSEFLAMPAPLYFNKSKAKYGYPDTEKSPRPKVMFINLISSVGLEAKCEFLLWSADLCFQQDFAFGYIHGEKDLLCLHNHPKFLGTLKLVLFLDGDIVSLIVPCLTCDVLMFQLVTTLSLQGIRKTWDDQNMNLHKYVSFMFNPRVKNCYPLLDELHLIASLTDFDFCPVLTIADKYNLTLMEYRLGMKLYGRRSYGLALTAKSNFDLNFGYVLYQVDLRTTSFVTLTNPPTPEAGLSTFVSPFESETWCFILVVVISVACFLTFLESDEGFAMVNRGEICHAWIYFTTLISEKVITVTFIFLGQVGDSAGRTYGKRNVALILFTLWFFGNLFLMVNYYQGSIYSCLAVLFPPKAPREVEELADLDVSMVAMDNYRTRNGTKYTYLQDMVFPQLNSSVSQTPKFVKFITKLDAKLLSINDPSPMEMYQKILYSNSTHEKPMVVFIFKDLFEFYASFVKYMGNRHVVQSRGDSPFRVIYLRPGNKNLFTPYLAKGLRRLSESGLTQMWLDLNRLPRILRSKKMLIARNKYFQAVQDLFGKVREPVTFHEDSVVSLDLILPAFSISAVVTAIGLGVFTAENSRTLKFWGKIVVKCVKELGMKIFNVVRDWTILITFSIRKLVTQALNGYRGALHKFCPG